MIEKKAEVIINEARKREDSSPREASILYLDAAEIYLYLSQSENPHLRNMFMSKAQQCYSKYEQINNSNTSQTPLIEENKEGTKHRSKITFKDIGGLEDLKREIRLRIVEPLKNPEVFKRFGKQVGGGILMYGPPGCGKSLIAEATANEANATFFHVKASDLKSKYVGETEQNIAKLFEKAREKAPSIIFFDEFEVLGGDRNSTDQYTKQAVSQLLTEMDGMGSKDQQILLLAATNEPWNIDLALRREGRFGRSLFIPPPDIESRAKIMEILLKGKPLSGDIHAKEIAEATPFYSGADLKGLIEGATDIPLNEYIDTKRIRDICREDFRHVLIERKRPGSVTWFINANKHLSNRGMEEDFPEVGRIAKTLEDNKMIVSVKA